MSMMSTLYKSSLGLVLAVLLSLLLSACAPVRQNSVAATEQAGIVSVDPVFREFYKSLGAYPVMGPAISKLFLKEKAQCQYTVTALMCYNPNLARNDQFSLAPLGKDFGIMDRPEILGEGAGGIVVDGFTVYDEFIPTYRKLAAYAGHPLTRVRVNYDEQRIEQYFENIGFYRRLDSKPEDVKLMAYGASLCDERCKFSPEPESGIIRDESQNIEQLFPKQILRVGNNTPIFGRPLTQPFAAPDGSLEQVYERAVFYASNDDITQMKLRPAPIILGVSFSLPGAKIDDPRYVFYPVQGNLGYNVPVWFDNFITAHGGKEISGQPISKVTRVANTKVYRQCFEHYCLDFDQTAAEQMRVRLVPIGKAYIDHMGLNDKLVGKSIYSREQVLIKIGEKSPQVTATEPQEISVVLMQRNNHQPIPNILGIITLSTPDGRTFTQALPPTGADGRSTAVIPVIENLANGNLISYTVCMSLPSDTPVCEPDSYLIWNSN